MTRMTSVLGLCDGQDRLVEAEPALAGLQLRCGGDMPGTLAVPSLLTLVRRTRASGVAQVQTLGAVDDGKMIAFLAHVAPAGEGTRIALSQWRLASETVPEIGSDADIPYQIAALRAVLDGEQRVLAADIRGDDADTAADTAALQALAKRWQQSGTAWSEAVDLIGVAHRQPLHWRLLDDVAFRIEGSDRVWRARIVPQHSVGFDLLITTDGLREPAPEAEAEAGSVTTPGSRLIGRDLAPALRQPINRIIANAETIRTRLAGPLSDSYASYAADIAEAGRHLLALVEDLADLDAVEAPEFAPAPDRIDLADCARRAAGILAMRAQERGIVLAMPALTQTVPAIGEFRRVLQILLNLLTNAIRYSPAHSTVTIETGGDTTRAWIAVRDEGDGLNEDQIARVFEKFERLGRTGDGGSGLGLYISRRLARAMGGDLTVAPGPGAQFVLTLPGRAAG